MRKKKEGGRKDRKGEDEDGQADEIRSDEDTKENICGKKIARYERRSRGRTI